jgi:SAM-dependent methyltransferase
MDDALQTLLRSEALTRALVLDLRTEKTFLAGHLRGAAHRALEPALLAMDPARRERWLQDALPSIFLPPRHAPLAVVAEDGDLARTVAGWLANRGRQQVLGCGLDAAALARLPSELVASGPSRHCLWQAPRFLTRWSHLLLPPAAGPVLDLACGSGRSAVWLAERGWRVTGVDHQAEALALAARLAADRGVPVTLAPEDLRRRAALPEGPWAAVLMFRFLHRPLVQRLARVLRPGAIVMLQTFREAPGDLGNPRPPHRLRGGELPALLPGPADLLVHEVGFDDDGRPAAGAVWRWQGAAAESSADGAT